jgi:hypothetical protein
MSKRVVVLCLLVGAVVMCLDLPVHAQVTPGPKKTPSVVTVTIVGMGMDKDEARRDAMRKAVEKAAGTYIYSQSQTKDFALVRDTILTRSAGFIQEHKVLSATRMADGTWEVKVTARVSVRGVVDTWGVVKTLLKEMGRPKIVVFISEKIDRAIQDDSTVQTRIEKLLLDSGFLLVNKQQIAAIREKDLEAAVAEHNLPKLQAVAKRFGAQLFISGSTSATLTSSRPVYGVEMHRYGSDGDIKCYRSDTAQLLAARNGTGYSADRTSHVAAKKALSVLGDRMGPQVREDILNFWSDVLQGRGELALEVQGVSFKQYVNLKKALSQVKQIKDVSATYNNRIAKCSIQSEVKAETLAEKLVEAIENLEVTDVSQNVIKAKLTN